MNRLFPELLAPKLHPANVGHDFTREGAVTPALLELYRARAVRMSLFQDDMKGAMEGLHAIFRMGAKLICSAAAPTDMGDWEAPRQELMRFYIGLAKGEDPELIFDAFISWEIRPDGGVHPHSGGGLCIPGDAVGGPLLRLPADGGGDRAEALVLLPGPAIPGSGL